MLPQLKSGDAAHLKFWIYSIPHRIGLYYQKMNCNLVVFHLQSYLNRLIFLLFLDFQEQQGKLLSSYL